MNNKIPLTLTLCCSVVAQPVRKYDDVVVVNIDAINHFIQDGKSVNKDGKC